MILLKGKELSDKLYDLFDLKKETAKLVVFTVSGGVGPMTVYSLIENLINQ